MVVPGCSVLPDVSSVGASTVSPSRRRLGWVALVARIFAVDVMRRPSCGSRLGLGLMIDYWIHLEEGV